jgi:hypothetical protein
MCGPSKSATWPKSPTSRSVPTKPRVWVISSLTLTVKTNRRPAHCRSHVFTVATVGQE